MSGRGKGRLQLGIPLERRDVATFGYPPRKKDKMKDVYT